MNNFIIPCRSIPMPYYKTIGPEPEPDYTTLPLTF